MTSFGLLVSLADVLEPVRDRVTPKVDCPFAVDVAHRLQQVSYELPLVLCRRLLAHRQLDLVPQHFDTVELWRVSGVEHNVNTQ